MSACILMSCGSARCWRLLGLKPVPNPQIVRRAALSTPVVLGNYSKVQVTARWGITMRRPLTFVAVLSVIAAALSVSSAADGRTSPEASASARPAIDKPLWQEARDYYSTLRAPREVPTGEPESARDVKRKATWWDDAQRRQSTGFPAAAEELARREAVSERTGRNPAAMLRSSGASPVTRAKLLTAAGGVRPRRERRLLRLGEARRPVRPGRLHRRARRNVC